MSNKKTRYFVAISGAVLAIGLGTGILASYMGLPVSVFTSAAGPEELQYVPSNAAVVAYANVRDVMNSEFLARGRFEAARLEALAIEHGAQAADYNGKRLITHSDKSGDDMAFGFVDADMVAFGATSTVKAAIDARASNRNIVSNNDMMKLVNDIDNANAWAVGRFDAIASKAGLPAEIQSQMPAITWFSAAGHINGGLSGTFKAETKDEATAKNLRDVMQGFLALAKMQAGNKPGFQQLADSLQLSGEGNNVALGFSIPSEMLDVLEGMAKAHKGAQQ